MAKEGTLWFEIGADNTQFARTANDTNKRIGQMSSSVKEFANGMKASFVEAAKSMAGFYAVAKAGTLFTDLISQNDQFNRSMKEVATLSEDVANNLDKYKSQILDMTTKIPIGADDAAKALYQINSAGHAGADGMKVLEASAKAAIGGVTDTATAADTITTVLNAYKMASSDAAKVSDMLFTAVKLGKTSMGELGSSIANVAPLAASFGVGIDQVLAAIASLTKNGTPTAQAVTQIRAAIVSLGSALGATYFQTHTLQEGMNEIRAAIPDNNKLKESMGTIEAVNAILAMTGDNAQGAAADLNEFANSAGAAGAAFDTMSTGKGVELTKLQNNLMKEMANVNTEISKVIEKVAKVMNEAFANGDIEKCVESIKDLVIAYGTYKGIVILAAAAQKAYNLVMEEYKYQVALANIGANTYSASQAGVAVATTTVTAAQAAQSTVMGLLSRAWQALTAAMASNPIGLVAVAITALIYAGYKLVQYFDEEEERLKGVTAGMDEYGRSVEDVKTANEELASTYKKVNADMNESIVKLKSFSGNKEAEKQLVDELNQKYGDAMGYYGSVADWYKVLTANSAAYCKQMINEAEIRQYANQIAENNSKINDIKYNSDGSVKLYNTNKNKRLVGNAQGYFEVQETASDQEIAKNDINKLRASNNILQKRMESLLNDNAKIQENIKTEIKGTHQIKPDKKAATIIDKKRGKGGKTKEQIASELAQEKADLLDAENKNARDRERQEQDIADRLLQAQIKMMDEGTEKKIAQMKYNADRELIALDREEEDKIQEAIAKQKELFDKQEEATAKRNKKYAKKVFSVDNLSDEQATELSSSLSSIQSQYQALRGQMLESQKADEDKVRYEMIKAENTAQYQLLQQFGDYQQKKQGIELEYATKAEEIRRKDASAVEKQTLLKINDKQQKAALKALDEQFKGVTQSMIDLFGEASRKSVGEINDIIDKYEELVKYLNGDKSIDLGALGFTDDDIQKLKEGKISIKDITDALKQLKGELANKSPWQSFKKNMEDALDDIKKDLGSGISGIGNAVTEFAPNVKEFGNSLSNIVGNDELADKIGRATEAISGLGNTASGVGQIMSGDIVGGTMKAVNGISQMVTALDGMFGADYSEYNAMVEQYDKLSSVWDEIISKKQKYIDISYGDEARAASKEVERLYQNEMQSAITLGLERLNSGASAGSHAIGTRQRKGMNIQGWNELKAAAKTIGFNYNSVSDGRMEGLFDLSSKQLEQLKEQAPTFWAKLDTDVQGYLNKIIECGDAIEDNKKAMQESLTGTSFDSFYDNFVSMLTDMDKSSSDFAESFQDYLKNAILQSLLANKYKARIEKLYNDWTTASDSDNDGVFDLTSTEAQALKASEKALADEMIAERNVMASAFGWKSSSSSQNASTKGFAGMSEDTANELNGRFTALQISGENIANSITTISAQITLMASQQNVYLSDILNQHAQSNGYLEDISKYTKGMYLELDGKIQKLVDNTRNL